MYCIANSSWLVGVPYTVVLKGNYLIGPVTLHNNAGNTTRVAYNFMFAFSSILPTSKPIQTQNTLNNLRSRANTILSLFNSTIPYN